MSTKVAKKQVPDKMQTGQNTVDTDSDFYVPAKEVKRLVASATTNMQIMKEKIVESGSDILVRDEIIEKLKTTCDIYEQKYRQAHSELESYRDKVHHKIDLTNADVFLGMQAKDWNDEIQQMYKKTREQKLKEFAKYDVQ